MKTLVLGAEDVKQVLSMKDCISAMDGAFRAMARGEASFPPRQAMPQPDKKGIVGMMPGYFGPRGVVGLKVVTVFPGNLGTPFESHQGAVLLFETTNGSLLGMVDAGEVTKVRTGAASGVATSALANSECTTLAILGSGTQAESHLEAMLCVRPSIKEVRVWSRSPENAAKFASRPRAPGSFAVTPARTAKEAVKGANIVCTVTASNTPILHGDMVEDGMHINAVGASRPPSRELDSKAVAKSSLFVDSKVSASLESDDYRIPLHDGVIGEDHIRGEIGEVLEGKVRGRRSKSEVTLFKSLGLAVEDLAAASLALENAKAQGKGTWVDFSAGR